MITDIITVTDDLQGMDAAIEAEEKFAAYYGITGKDALHLRLLTEEMISMIHGIFNEFSGDFRLESERTKKGLLCRLCLSAKKQVNKEEEAHILSVASSGKNESAKGIAGKIRELFRQSLQSESYAYDQFLTNMADAWGHTEMSDTTYWSLQSYRQSISPKAKPEEWDELEKSIIAKLADEVKVWLKTDTTEIVAEKLIRL